MNRSIFYQFFDYSFIYYDILEAFITPERIAIRCGKISDSAFALLEQLFECL